MSRVRPPRSQRGGALLLAMVILTLVTTLAAGMIWQQWRAIEVETAERARAQAAWILTGALDWARLILREDKADVDDLTEPWAVPLAEARLSTFLAAERNVTDEAGIEAFLSGSIEDAQSRYNLRNVVRVNNENKLVADVRALERLCELAGLPKDVAARIAAGLSDAMAPAARADAAPLMPNTVSQLAWFGLEPDSVERLRPWVDLLPRETRVNVNTASAEVIAAAIEGIDVGVAQRLVEARRRTPFRSLADVQPHLPEGIKPDDLARSVDIRTQYFVVRGRLRLGERVLEEKSLVRRPSPRTVVVVRRERINLVAGER